MSTPAPGDSGPQPPEFASFAPAEQADRMDLFTGDFRYSVPLLNVPGPNGSFPIALSYQSGISLDVEASWAGLGWTLNPGSINRQLRGLPDDFKGDVECTNLGNGDCVSTTEDIEPNWTFGLGLDANLELLGADTGLGLGLSAGMKGYFNSYRGLGYSRNIGLSGQASANGISGAVGLNLSNDSQQGFRASPSLSLADTLSVNATLDAMTGLSSLNVGAQYRNYLRVEADALSFAGYARPTILPGPGRDMTGWNIEVSIKGGGEIQGVYANLQASGFYNVEQVKNPNERFSRGVGYLHFDQALDVPADVRDGLVLDFNREHDGPIYDDSTNLTVPVVTNDLFTLSGPGVAGTFRAYRNDIPWLYDAKQTTELLGGSLGVDIGGGLIAKFGASGSINGTKGESGGWDGGNQAALLTGLRQAVPSVADAPVDFERTYFKLIGETTPQALGSVLPGQDVPVAVPIKPVPFDLANLPPDYFSAEAALSSDGNNRLPLTINTSARAPRGTLIESFTNEQLDRNPLAFPEFVGLRARLYAQRRPNHIGGFRVTAPDGMRYVYAIPVYNTVHEEHEFSVARQNFQSGTQCEIVRPPAASQWEYDYKIVGTEQFRHIKKVSPYVITHLLTAVLGPDYIDADGIPGPSEGDFGYWARLDYDKRPGTFAWRRPYYGAQFVRGPDNGPFVAGQQRRSDKAFFSYGEREEWYLSAVHTRTHVARFYLAPREDNHAAAGRVQNSPTAVGRASQRIDRIELFAKDTLRPELQWVPIQTVHFQFDNSLQRGAPGVASAAVGKLTLKKVWTTFERNSRTETSPHEFDYEAGDAANNPPYAWNSADRWGSYQPGAQTLTLAQCAISGGQSDPTLSVSRSYVDQQSPAAERNRQVAAWSLRRIVEPTGREVSTTYESDDYGLVQDRFATAMTRIVAVGNPNTAMPDTIDKRSNTDPQAHDALRVYFAVPVGTLAQGLRTRLVGQSSRVYFRIRVALKDGVNDPVNGKWETVSGYANVADSGVTTTTDGRTLGWLELERTQNFHPFSVAAWQHLRLVQPELVSQSAINGDPSGDAFTEAIKVLTIADFIEEIVALARGVYPTWFDRNWGQRLDLENSFLRLQLLSGVKFGGGARLQRITYRDRWSDATGGVEPDLVTGYAYDYRLPDGRSSGVASYEPSDGADENSVRDALPFTQMVLLSSSYNLFAERPVAESYFPAPNVGYSRVVVRTLASEDARDRARQGQIPTRTSTAGPIVHEFYTSADFPVQTGETPLSKKRNPQPWVVPIPFLGSITLNSMVASQGYLVNLNDMHGKVKRVSHYEYGRQWDAATQDFVVRGLPTTSKEYFYRASGGVGGTSFTLDGNLPVLLADAQRAQADMPFAREAEMFIDTRRNRTESFSAGINVNVDLTYALFPIPLVVPVPSMSYSLTEAKTAVAMKVVHQSGILDHVVERAGPAETTQSDHLYDALSGRPLLNSMTNEFGDLIYDYRLPARWTYPRMGAAYANTGLQISLAGAQLIGDRQLRLTAPPIPACSETEPTTGTCLPLGSHFAAGQGQSARLLVLESADASGLLFRATTDLNSVPATDAMLVQSGNANLLNADAGQIRALSDPTTGRTPETCHWTTREACGVCYVKEKVSELSCAAQTWIAALGSDKRKSKSDKDCARVAASFGKPLVDERHTDPFKPTRAARGRACRTLLVDANNKPVNATTFSAVGNAEVADSPPATQVGGLPFSGVSFDAVVEDQQTTAFIYSDCDGWLSETTTSKPLIDYCEVKHEQTRTRIKDVLSASATTFSDSWPSVAEEVRFTGTPAQIGIAKDHYDELDDFSKGVRGIWRRWRGYAYVEDRHQSADVNLRRDGAFDLLAFNWSDTDNPICTPQWRWKTQVTRYAPSGNEVEEVSPLGVHSAALYGHTQRVPLAVAANARQSEILSEGFEAFKAGVEVSPEQTGEGHFEYHTVTHKQALPPAQCAADVLIRGRMDGDLIHVVEVGVPLHGVSGVQDPDLSQWTKRSQLDHVFADIPGESCPVQVTGVSHGEEGGFTLALDRTTVKCPTRRMSQPGLSVPLAGHTQGIRLFTDCSDSWRHTVVRKIDVSSVKAHTGATSLAVATHHDFRQPYLRLVAGRRYVVSAWVSRDNTDVPTYRDVETLGVQVKFWNGTNELIASRPAILHPEGPVIDGWQRIQGTFIYPANADGISLSLQNGADRSAPRAFFDDVRLLPEAAQLEAFVYDPATFRVVARLDAENYARFFSYHADGTLAQTQQETPSGRLTAAEARTHAAERP